MIDIKFYVKFICIAITIFCIGMMIFYTIKSERKIATLEEEKIALTITKETLEATLEEQKQIIQNIYNKSKQQEKIIKQNAKKLKIMHIDENIQNQIKKEIASFKDL